MFFRIQFSFKKMVQIEVHSIQHLLQEPIQALMSHLKVIGWSHLQHAGSAFLGIA